MLSVSAWSKMLDYLQTSPQKIELSPGQVFKGTVLQLYPDNLAKVQIGGMQLYARLEAPLQAGLQYWLQVQSGGHPASLRVLPEPGGGGRLTQPVAAGLLRALHLPDNKENREIVEYMSRQQLPLSKELLKQFVALTGKLGAKEEVWELAALAVKKGLPVSVQTVQSLRKFLHGPGIERLISHFLGAADLFLQSVGGKADAQPQPLPASATATGQNSAAGSLSAANSSHAAANSEQAVIPAGWGQLKGTAESVPPSGAAPAATAAATAATTQVARAAQSAVQPAAAGAETAQPEHTATAQPEHRASSATPSMRSAATAERHNSAAMPVATEARLSGSAEGQGEIAGKQAGTATTLIRELLALLNRCVPRMALPDDASAGGTVERGSTALFSREDLGQFFRLLGVNHEKEVLRHLNNHASNIVLLPENGERQSGEPVANHNVKHLLLQLIGQYGDALPAALRESAENLLSYITGQQLLAVNHQGEVFPQVILQIPLPTGRDGHKAVVHMHSRKKANGELDPENCRLFFHLQLENLGETMLDVSIVDRVVAMVVFTGNGEQSAEATAAIDAAEIFLGGKSALQAGLQQQGYILSSFRVQPWADMAGRQKENGPAKLLSHVFSEYRGVDVRV